MSRQACTDTLNTSIGTDQASITIEGLADESATIMGKGFVGTFITTTRW